jgi:transcriptional regulator of acetoin/glycerol metabolism
MRTRRPISAIDILRALEASKGHVAEAAKRLEVSDRTLYRRMAEFGIKSRLDYRVDAA